MWMYHYLLNQYTIFNDHILKDYFIFKKILFPLEDWPMKKYMLEL